MLWKKNMIWIIWVLCTICACEKLVISNTYINDYLAGSQEKVEQLKEKFEGKNISEVHIDSVAFSEKGMKKLLEMDISSVKRLTIEESIIGDDAAKALFRHSLFPNLQELQLDFCSLNDEAFEELQPQSISIRNLSFANNYISQKGFQHLAGLNFTRLEGLNISGNSLYYNKTVDALLSIDLSHIKSINVADTSISEANLFRLLHKIKVEELQSLTLGSNDLQWGFWREFSELKFPKLERLILSELLIDEDAVPFLAKMHFPALKTLNINDNDLTTTQAIKLINTKTMPLLKQLSVDNNFLNSTFIKHLADQKYKFKIFTCKVRNMDKNTMSELLKLDFSRMETFLFTDNTVSPELVHQFFNENNFTTLKFLVLENLVHPGNLLFEVFNTQLPSLQKLTLINWLDSMDFSMKLEDKVYLPKLTHLQLYSINLKYEDIQQLIRNITKFAPSISKINLYLDFQDLIIDILKNQITNITHPLNIVMNSFQFTLEPNKRPYVTHGNLTNLALIIEVQKILDGKISDGSTFQLKDVFTIVAKSFEMQRLEIISHSANLPIIKDYLEKNPRCVFEQLKHLEISISSEEEMNDIRKCHFPNLREIEFIFSLSSDNFTFLETQLFSNIQALAFSSESNISNIITANLINFRSERLSRVDLRNLFIEDEQFYQIFNEMYNFKHVKGLLLDSNFIFEKKDIKYDFRNLKLEGFQLAEVNIGDQFKDIDSLNTEFLKTLVVRRAGLYSKHFIGFLTQKKNQMGGTVFPRLKNLDISDNYLTSEGIKQLLESGLPQITALITEKIQDPQIFNTIFTSRFSRKLKGFITDDNYMDSINPNIDPRHTRRLIALHIYSKSLQDEDYQALSKFDFFALDIAQLVLFNVNQCQTLESLLKILQNANMISLILVQSDFLDSSCIDYTSKKYQNLVPSQLILSIASPYAYLGNFVSAFLHEGQKIDTLIAPVTYISDQQLMEISQKADFSAVNGLQLSMNNLTDISVAKLLTKIVSASAIDLRKNVFLTSQCLKDIKNKTFQNLQQLYLSSTGIGDQAIQYLLSSSFPSLVLLEIASTEITGEGLRRLSRLKAPNLLLIDLSCNKLGLRDIIKFSSKNFVYLQLIVLYPEVDIDDYNSINAHFQRERIGQDYQQIQILTTISYRSQTEK